MSRLYVERTERGMLWVTVLWIVVSTLSLICCGTRTNEDLPLFQGSISAFSPEAASLQNHMKDNELKEVNKGYDDQVLEESQSCSAFPLWRRGYTMLPETQHRGSKNRNQTNDALVNLLTKLNSVESQCTQKQQIIVVVDHGTAAAQVDIWRVDTEACPMRMRRIFWESLQLDSSNIVHLTAQVFMLWMMNYRMDSNPDDKFLDLKTNMEHVLSGITQNVTVNLSIFADVPVIFRSSVMRDIPVSLRGHIMYAVRRVINEYQDASGINLYTSPLLTTVNGGTMDGIEAFYGVNFRSLCLRQKKKLSMNSSQWEGILNLRLSNVVVTDAPYNHDLVNRGGVEKEHLKPLFPVLPLFTTRFVNYGQSRALALLVKQYCAETKPVKLKVGNSFVQFPPPLDAGVCRFPCFNKGWEQSCVMGSIAIERNPDHFNRSYVKVVQNSLLRPSAFCSEELNQALRLARLREICISVGLPPSGRKKDRMGVPGCYTIVGTGEPHLCSALISHYIMSLEMPGNQDATYVGTAVPFEVGNTEVLRMTSPLRVSGPFITQDITMLMEKGLLNLSSSHSVIDALSSAAVEVCKMIVDFNNLTVSGFSSVPSLSVSSSDSIPIENKHFVLPLTANVGSRCFNMYHLIHLLRAFGAEKYSLDSPTGSAIRLDVNVSRPKLHPSGPSISRSASYSGAQDRLCAQNDGIFLRTLGVVVRNLFHPKFYHHVYGLGALHWKGNNYMSELDDLINQDSV